MENILKPNAILNTIHYVANAATKKYYRDGIELEKGAIITEKRIEKNRELYTKYCEFWTVYPDLFVDMITPVSSKFSLKFFQRLFLRVCLRQGRVLTIAPRAAGKSFICILALYLICIFRPRSHVFQCYGVAPVYREMYRKRLVKSGKILKLLLPKCYESRNKIIDGIWLNPKFC